LATFFSDLPKSDLGLLLLAVEGPEAENLQFDMTSVAADPSLPTTKLPSEALPSFFGQPKQIISHGRTDLGLIHAAMTASPPFYLSTSADESYK
jgi:hypothetical protein